MASTMPTSQALTSILEAFGGAFVDVFVFVDAVLFFRFSLQDARIYQNLLEMPLQDGKTDRAPSVRGEGQGWVSIHRQPESLQLAVKLLQALELRAGWLWRGAAAGF
jgi:hypothetical protein